MASCWRSISATTTLRSCLVTRDRLAPGYQDLPIRVRAGLHCGKALRREDDFYGRTIIIATRISSLALGGEILTSDVVRALTHGLGTFTFGEARNVTLKGLDGSFEIYPVLAHKHTCAVMPRGAASTSAPGGDSNPRPAD